MIGLGHEGLPVTAAFTELGITAIAFTYVNFGERERDRGEKDRKTKCERVNKREKKQQWVTQDKKHSVV